MAADGQVGPKEEDSVTEASDLNIQQSYPSDKRRRFLLLAGFTILFYIGLSGSGSLWPQYLLDRLRKQANLTDQSGNITEKSPCTVNISDPNYIHEQKLQERSSSIIAATTFLGGIPNIFTVFIYGSLSDRIGRKTVIVIAYVGLVLNNLVLTFLTNLHAPIYIYFISSFINGVCGSSATLMAGILAYVADLTPPDGRGFAIAVIQGALGLAVVITNLLVGWSIKLMSFGHSMIWLTVVTAVSIGLLIPLPETRRFQDEMREASNVQKLHQRLWVILKVKVSDMKQLLVVNKRRSICFLSLTGSVLIFTLAYEGVSSTTYLYLLNRPFCWNSVILGYYGAVKVTLIAIGTAVVLMLLKDRLSGFGFIFMGAIFCIVTFTFQGIASVFLVPMCNVLMIISTITSFCIILVPIMARTVSSKLASKDEQGAVFGLMASAESFSTSFGPTIMSVIYSATVKKFQGTVYIFCAGIQIIVLVLSIIYKRLSETPQNHDAVLEPMPNENK